MKRKYDFYTCKKCGSRHRALIESICYINKICPKCLNEISMEPLIIGWKSPEELSKYYMEIE